MSGCPLSWVPTVLSNYPCHKLPSYEPYKGTYVLYKGTFGAPDQGQMLDVWLLKLKSSKGILRGQPISVYWPQTKNLTWDVPYLTSNWKVSAQRTWARDCLYQRHTHYRCRSISRFKYDPSVNRTAESSFTTIVNKKRKQSKTKMDGSLKYNGAN